MYLIGTLSIRWYSPMSLNKLCTEGRVTVFSCWLFSMQAKALSFFCRSIRMALLTVPTSFPPQIFAEIYLFAYTVYTSHLPSQHPTTRRPLSFTLPFLNAIIMVILRSPIQLKGIYQQTQTQAFTCTPRLIFLRLHDTVDLILLCTFNVFKDRDLVKYVPFIDELFSYHSKRLTELLFLKSSTNSILSLDYVQHCH